MKNLFKIALVSTLTLLCFSCYYDEFPEEIEVIIDPDVEVTFANDILPIFDSYNCIECHNGGSTNPDLRPDQAYSSLVPSYVIAGNSTDSRLYKQLKINEHRNVDDTSIALIKKWIEDGAENN